MYSKGFQYLILEFSVTVLQVPEINVIILCIAVVCISVSVFSGLERKGKLLKTSISSVLFSCL